MSPTSPSNPAGAEALFLERLQLKALARRLLADEHGAEDILQDAWVLALEQPPPKDRPLGAWMSEVVRRLAWRRHRGETRARERDAQVARPAKTTDPEDATARLQTERTVIDAVLALDEDLRTTVHARYFEGRPPREIARLQGISIHTVNDRLKRARRLLRVDLERRLEGDDRDHRDHWALALVPMAALSSRSVEYLLAQGSGPWPLAFPWSLRRPHPSF